MRRAVELTTKPSDEQNLVRAFVLNSLAVTKV